MLTTIVAHDGPVDPAQLWSAWSWNPVVALGIVAAAVVHHRGARGRRSHDSRTHETRSHNSRSHRRWRTRAFVAGLATLAAALLSPLDALSGSLASAHMVQHLILTLVAAVLLAVAAPLPALVRGLPERLRPPARRVRRTPAARTGSRVGRQVATMSLLHVITIWFWHARAPYDAAVRNELLHALEHLSFLATAVLSWAAIVRVVRHRKPRDGAGSAVLVLFALAVQGSILGALLTFAPRPWYDSYETTTAAWDLTPLGDQQLAGLIMWVPAGVVYLIAALVVLVTWIHEGDRRRDRPTAPRSPTAPSAAASSPHAS